MSIIPLELEIESLRFSLKRLEAELALTKAELESQRKSNVTLTVALRREVNKSQPFQKGGGSSSVPAIPRIKDETSSVGDPIDDTLTRDAALWNKLRIEYLSLCDENENLKDSMRSAESTLRRERERRLKEIESMKLVIAQKDNEILNFKTSFDALMKRSVELEDSIAKAKLAPPAHTGSASTTSAESARSSSPPPQINLQSNIFSRNYAQSSANFVTMSRVPHHIGSQGPSPIQSSIPMYSPVMMSRQILPSPIQQHQIVRRYPDGKKA